MTHLLIAFVILVVLLIVGVPVMYCFGAALLYIAATLGYTATGIFPTIYGKLSSVVLLSIPLFILAGKIMEHGKWWALRDSNPRPTGYEPVALTN